ncbi:response regulator [Clostridium lundense]|uniref:response regulator n=1 Tax=Clostridium lundense TaxID=319475 RepID=UPI0004896FE9|nr:response regulator [Clostridium lundense]
MDKNTDLYGCLFKNADNIILVVSIDGKIIDANDIAVNSYGYSHEELINMKIFKLRNNQIKSIVDAQIMKALKEEVVYFQTYHFRKDGTKFPVKVKIKAIEVENEKYLLSTIKDISQKKHKEENFKQKYEELREANRTIFLLKKELYIKNNEIQRLKEILEEYKKREESSKDNKTDVNSAVSEERISGRWLAAKNKNLNITVLIVEDNEISKQIAISFLSKKGYKVICAGDGRVALEILENNEIDIILMDLEMPVLDGYETIKIIRKRNFNNKYIPIIVMTAYLENKHKEMCLSMGVEDYISKPFSSIELCSKIEKYFPVK